MTRPRETVPVLREVRAEGLRLAVREWPGPPGAPAVLLLHGLASTARIWDLVAPRLAGRFRVVAYDQRGHGESGKPASGYGFDRVTADALEVIRRLRLGRPLVVGHSWGASVAAHLASLPRTPVAGAMLIDGGFVPMRERMDWETARERLRPPPLAGMPLGEFLARGRRMLSPHLEVTPEVEAVLRSLVRVDGEGRIHPRLALRNHLRILRAMWESDPPAVLRRARVPVLVLAVASDRPEDRDFVAAKRRAAAALRDLPGVRLEWARGIHDLPLQRPALLARRLVRFAAELGPGPGTASATARAGSGAGSSAAPAARRRPGPGPRARPPRAPRGARGA
ncbi:MAG TPA: alpha/beta fold hydrolase [Actinomycetota bacterium]|nr:alpha/beta fold hydrolase [Actinomycetota bacterium]